jgi:AcrR family transcriptional regulator
MTPPAKTQSAPPDEPLTPERILAAAEEVLRRYGPQKATVVDVARHLGVSHGSVYRHFPSKAALRDAVTARFLRRVADELAPVVAAPGPAPDRLRRWVTTLVAIKRARRASAERELHETYKTLAAEARDVVADHVAHLVAQAAAIVAAGIAEGSFRAVDPVAAGRAVLAGTALFHNPAFAPDWGDPTTERALTDLLDLILAGLAPPSPANAP